MIKCIVGISAVSFLIYGQMPNVPLPIESNVVGTGVLVSLFVWMLTVDNPKQRRLDRESMETVVDKIGAQSEKTQVFHHKEVTALTAAVADMTTACRQRQDHDHRTPEAG